jgi:hypothetical protein
MPTLERFIATFAGAFMLFTASNTLAPSTGRGAQIVQDQSNVAMTATPMTAYVVDANYGEAQVVTAGLTGLLSRVELGVFRYAGHTEPLLVSIAPIIGGLPDLSTEAMLAMRSIPFSEVSLERTPVSYNLTVDFSDEHLYFQAGQQFAIVLQSKEAPRYAGYAWWINLDMDTYDGGSVATFDAEYPVPLLSPTDDAHFRTFVAVPEPATLALGASAVVCLAALRRK